MKTAAALVLAASLAACTTAGPESSFQPSGAAAGGGAAGGHPAEFEGRWEATTTGKGGVGTVIDLAPDGAMVGGLVILVGAKWTLMGPRLQFRNDDGGANETEVSFDGGTMNVVHGGAPGRHRRVGAATPGAPPIVGIWTYPHPAGGNAFERYTAAGRMEFRLGMPGAARGTWSASGDSLTIDWKGDRRVYEASRSGDVLTLKSDGGSSDYRRADRWYVFPAVFRD
jgi:hypothetical protein